MASTLSGVLIKNKQQIMPITRTNCILKNTTRLEQNKVYKYLMIIIFTRMPRYSAIVMLNWAHLLSAV